MSNSMVAVPFSGEPDMADWLKECGLDVPDANAAGATPTLVRELLIALGWPFAEHAVEDGWGVAILTRDGRMPPLDEVSVRGGSLGFRLGPSYGPYLVVRAAAEHCGPYVVFEASGGSTCLVTSDTTYDDFHQALFELPAPADGSDREWIRVSRGGVQDGD